MIAAFLILDATSAQAQGRVPYYVTRLARGTNPLPLQITKRLASVGVPGFGNLFHAIDRSSFLTLDTYGLNIHSIIAMHESLFPNKRKLFLPEGMGELKKLEDNVPNLITNRQNEDGWKFPPSKTLLFESAIPAYLVTSAEEKIVLPSAAQLSEMITYYHQVLADPRGRFAQQMSAVTNLGLFGTSEDAVSILNLAQADFESFNPFKDAFITRALLSLRAYNELQQLAQIRLAETNSNKEPVLLSPVWNGVQQEMLERKKNLHIPSERIASTWETSPDVVNREIIARHPFAYVLANTSEKVTRDWLALRDSIDEQFNQAVMKENVVSQLRRDLSIKRPAPFTPPTIPAVKLGTGFNWPTVKPKTSSTPAPETVTPTAKPVPETAPVAKPALAQPTVSSAESIALPTPPKEKTPRKKQSVQPPAKKPAVQPQNTVTRARRSSDDFNKIQQVHLTLETYLKEHDDQLPPDGHALRFAVYRILKDVKKNDPDNPEAKALSDLWKSHLKLRGGSNGQAHHYDRTRQELEQYVAEHNGSYPPNSSALTRAIYRLLKQNPTDENGDIKAIRELWDKHYQKHPTRAPRNSHTPAQILAELTAYFETNETLPPNGSLYQAMRKALQKDKKNPQRDPTVLAIEQLWESRRQLPRYTTQEVYQNIVKFYEENGHLPKGVHKLYTLAYARMNNPELQNDPYVQALKQFWQEKQIQAIKDFGKTPKGERTNHNVSTVSTPREQVDPSAAQTPEQTLAQLQEKLNRFIKEHGRIPSENSTDPEEQNLRRAVQNLLNTALQLSALLTSR